MADVHAISRISLGGQKAGSGVHTETFTTDNAMFLKVFAGEVLEAFDEKNMMMGLTRVRSISSGKSAQFPFTGKASANYHAPGADILVDDDPDGNKYLSIMQVNERTINIDDLLISSCFIDNYDEMKSHFDYRGPFARQLGLALAYRVDKNLIKTMYIAGATTGSGAPMNNGMGAVNLESTTVAALTTANMIKAFYEASELMDQNDLPTEGRFAVVEPAVYNKLIQSAGALGNAINIDYGGEGSVASGKIMRVADIAIYKANHIADVRAEGATTINIGENNDYVDDYSTFGGVFGHQEAVGTVKLKDIALESEYKIERQGHLFVAKMGLGHGVLRADAAGYFDLAVTP